MDAHLLDTLRDAALGLDANAFERARADLGGRLARGWFEWAGVFARLLANDHEGARTGAEALERASAADRDAPLVIEAAALRALAIAELGDLEEARTTARRASRMARTEALPEQEHLAHLVLARIRRLTGQPHLAARILTSLERVAAPRFLPWIAWELAMAGARPRQDALERSAPTLARDAARTLGAFFDTAEREIASARSLDAFAASPLFGPDVAAIASAVEVDRQPLDASVAAWARGTSADSPPRLHGVFTARGNAPRDETAIAYVASHTAVGPRRVPRIAWASIADAIALPQGRKKHGRNESAVCALALAGPEGLDEDALFAEVYGFAFIPEMHRGVLAVCVHRAREYVGDAGAIESQNGRLRIAIEKPILVPDPRCAKPLQDRLLRAIAEHRRASPKDIAAAVGISLRVAQEKLAELSADGACIAHREGREVRYEIEDTTFSEPTAHGR